MEKFNHKVIVDPALITYLNKMDHEYTASFTDSINATAHAVDRVGNKLQENSNKEDLMKPQVTVKINAPVCNYRTVSNNGNQFKKELEKINNKFSDDSFKDSQNYRDLIGMANSSYSDELPKSHQFTKFKVDRYDVEVEICLSKPTKQNQIIKDTEVPIGKVEHYVFTFISKDFTGKMPIDLPPMVKDLDKEAK